MCKKHHTGNQHGVATLGITLMLLFIMTLVALYTAKTSIKEQQISANQYRADQSLSTANAALDWGMANYAETGGFACDKRLENITGLTYTCPTRVMCTIETSDTAECNFGFTKSAPLAIDDLSVGSAEMYYAFVKADGTELEYIPVQGGAGEIRIDDPTGEQDEERVYLAKIKIVGIGHSDDATGERTVSVDVDTSNIFGDPGLGSSAFPLVSKSTSGANASIEIINRYDNRTIWSGNELDISGSTNTYVLENGLDWNCNDIENHDKCVTSDSHGGEPLYTMPASDGVNNVNADIIDADTNLSNLDSDDFFKNFFGKEKDVMRQLARDTGLYVEADGQGNLTYVDESGNKVAINWAGLADHTPLVWIHMPTGVDYTPGGSDLAQLGTGLDPMVLIVDGNLKIGGTGNVGLLLVGVLYVTGTWDASSNPVVQGMVIVETDSDLSGAGTPTLIYDADLFGGKMAPPPGTIAGTTPGSWKDWE